MKRIIMYCSIVIAMICINSQSVNASNIEYSTTNFSIEEYVDEESYKNKELSLMESYGDVQYEYDEQGQRVSKITSSGEIEKYFYEDGLLKAYIKGNEELLFKYNEEMELLGFVWNEREYLYLFDDSKTVVGIVDDQNNRIVEYTYDIVNLPDGILGTEDSIWKDYSMNGDFIGVINPIRLYSYVFDEETKLYYNGLRYYDSTSKLFIGDGYELDDIDTYEEYLTSSSENISRSSQDLYGSILAWRNELLSSTSFGLPIDYSSNWYASLSDVEILSRLLYAENTLYSPDRVAIGWVLSNRKDAEYASTYRGIATASGQFASITSTSTNTQHARVPASGTNWDHAVWVACCLLGTSSVSDYNTLIPKPLGISSQEFFLSSSYFLSNTTDSTNGILYSGNLIKDVAQLREEGNVYNVTTRSTIENSVYHNVFFNY